MGKGAQETNVSYLLVSCGCMEHGRSDWSSIQLGGPILNNYPEPGALVLTLVEIRFSNRKRQKRNTVFVQRFKGKLQLACTVSDSD